MKKKIKLKGHLKNYMYWPLMLTILLACMNVPMYFVNEGAALLVSIFLGIYLIVVVISYNVNKPVLVNELINFATQYGTVQKKLLRALHSTIDDAMDAAGLPLLGVVPEDSDVPYALNRGIPLRDINYYAARAYENIARRITGHQVPLMRI